MDATVSSCPVFEASPEVVVMDLDQDTLVYQRERRRLLVLNPSAAAILRMCDGRRGEAEIAERMETKFPDVGTAAVGDDVRRTVEHLIELGLVTRN